MIQGGKTNNIQKFLIEGEEVIVLKAPVGSTDPDLGRVLWKYMESNFGRSFGFKESHQAWDKHQIASQYFKGPTQAQLQINTELEDGKPTDLDFKYQVRLQGPDAESEASKLIEYLPQLTRA